MYWSLSLSLSLVFVKKRKKREAWAIEKKLWTHEGPSIEKKKKEKNVGT